MRHAYLDGDQAEMVEDFDVVESAPGVALQVLVEEGAWHPPVPGRAHHLEDGILYVRHAGGRGISGGEREGSLSQLLTGHQHQVVLESARKMVVKEIETLLGPRKSVLIREVS